MPPPTNAESANWGAAVKAACGVHVCLGVRLARSLADYVAQANCGLALLRIERVAHRC